MKHTADADWGERLTGQIHDMWFCVDDVRINEEHQVVIPLRSEPKRLPLLHLVVPNARSVRVTDTERIGMYDIDCVKMQASRHLLSIHGNIPIRVDIETDDPYATYVMWKFS